jgi:phenylacetic acid degradation operon negative regulatory protein
MLRVSRLRHEDVVVEYRCPRRREDQIVTTAAVTRPVRQPHGRARSQRLLVTLFGDYARHRPPIPSAALVHILEGFGITPANTRAALSRLTQQGMLVRSRSGRRTSYSLTGSAVRLLEQGARRIFGLGAANEEWRGTWTVVVFSVPNVDSESRHLLRNRLRWLTFSPLYDAVWISPHDRTDATVEQLKELGISDAIVFRATSLTDLPGGRSRLTAAWDIDALATGYEHYLRRYGALAERALRGEVPPSEALIQRAELVDDWRKFARDDPDLPEQFMPDDFPRARARELFLTTYQALAQPATAQFDAVVRAHSETVS